MLSVQPCSTAERQGAADAGPEVWKVVFFCFVCATLIKFVAYTNL